MRFCVSATKRLPMRVSDTSWQNEAAPLTAKMATMAAGIHLSAVASCATKIRLIVSPMIQALSEVHAATSAMNRNARR